jgi:hypothetical protein
LRDFSILGGTWITSNNLGPFNGTGGIIGCNISPHRIKAASGPAYGNLYAYNLFNADVVETRRFGMELSFGSHGNTVITPVIACTESGQTVERVIGLTGGSRDNMVIIDDLNIGSHPADYVIEFLNSYENSVFIQSMTGASVVNSTVLLTQFAYVGTNVSTSYNDIEIANCSITTQQRYVLFGTSTFGNALTARFLGTAALNDAVLLVGSTENTIDVSIATGTVAIDAAAKRNKLRGTLASDIVALPDFVGLGSNDLNYNSASYYNLREHDYILSPTSYTNVAGLLRTTSYAANTFNVGDTISFRLRAICSGATATKLFELTAFGTVILSLPAIPGGANVLLDVNVVMNVASTTAVVGQVKYTLGATTTLLDIGIISLNLVTTAYTFVQKITVSAAGASEFFTTRDDSLVHGRPMNDNRHLVRV